MTQNKIFLWIAVGTALILFVPFLAMQFTREVNWNVFDFIVMGVLIFGGGSIFVLLARKVPKHRLLVGFIVLAALLWLWAELGVGVFTNWGD